MISEFASPAAAHPVRAAPRSPRRADILEAALACFNLLGYAQATIADVRRESGASVGSIYHHFGDKEGIAGALYVEGLRRYQSSLMQKILGNGPQTGARTARGLIRGIVTHSLDWMMTHPDWAQFLFEMRRTEGVAAAEADIRRETSAFFTQLSARVERHVKRGEIRNLPMEVMSALLVGPAQEIMRHWLRAGVPKDVNSIRDELADAAWRSLRTMAGRSPQRDQEGPQRFRTEPGAGMSRHEPIEGGT